MIEQLRRRLQFDRHDAPEERLRTLEGMLEQHGFALADVVPLFAALLSLPLSERYSPLALTPQRLKQQTLEALVAWLGKEAQHQPVLLIVEDLHWVDPSTLELLGLLVEQLVAERLFRLLTFRPDFRPPWPMLSHLTQLTLSRLGRTQVEVMVENIAGGKSLPTEVVQQVIAKTDGVPLFVEEVTKAVLESAPSPALAIPTTLHDSLMARLDRLANVKEVAQLAATIGREFGYELIAAVSPVDAADLQQALARLVEAELLYQRGQGPQARYVFKHALIQDAAYQSLVKSKRQRYHQQIARAMEERLPETIESPSCWPITTPKPVSSRRPCRTGRARGSEPSNARQTRRRSVTSSGDWSCSGGCRTPPSSPAGSSRSRSRWACRFGPRWASPLPRSERRTRGRGSCVSGRGRRLSSLPSCGASGNSTSCGRSTGLHASWDSSCWPWPNRCRIRVCSSLPTACWEIRCSGWESSRRRAHIWNTRSACTTPGNTRPMRFCMAMTSGWLA